MAVVVEAEDVNLKRPVAIKQLRDGLRGDAASRHRFFAEAEILAGLDHAGVVPVHEAGVLEDGGPFYAMAKVKGPTLADLLQSDHGAGFRVSTNRVTLITRDGQTEEIPLMQKTELAELILAAQGKTFAGMPPRAA